MMERERDGWDSCRSKEVNSWIGKNHTSSAVERKEREREREREGERERERVRIIVGNEGADD